MEQEYKIYEETNDLADTLFQSVLDEDLTITEALEVCAKLPLFLLAKSLPHDDIERYLDNSRQATAEVANTLLTIYDDKESITLPELCCIASASMEYIMSLINK